MKSTVSLPWLFALSFLPTFLFSQIPAIQFKLQLLTTNKWGVYAKSNTPIGANTITASGQATVVMPLNYAWNSLVNVNGIWSANAVVHGPIENPTKSYIHFGWAASDIQFQTAAETLLFTFKGDGTCPDSLYLMENDTDPFNQLPNSYYSNPENEITVFEPEGLYWYDSNYATYAWSCHDNDDDGTSNAFEDTNGNGTYDPGVDASDLNTDEPEPGILFKLHLLEENKWGVFAKSNTPIGQNTITGSGQVTIVMPKHYAWNSLVNVNGIWANNAPVHGPVENPTKSYISLGWQASDVQFQPGVETLLLTFKGDGTCPDSLYLIENDTDPFDQLPNSYYSHPGNEITIFEPGQLYNYLDNYATSAWSCHDNDGDGTLNAFEDTNGNGSFDPGVDASDLNQAECTANATFTDHPDDIAICAGSDASLTATASISQGTFSFGWQYSDDGGGTWTDIDFTAMAALYSHTATGTVASGTDTLTIANVANLYNRRFRAVANATDCSPVYSNYAVLSVQGPLSVTDEPDPVMECAGDATTFSATIANPGEPGSTIYRWQISMDGGTTWADLSDDAIYNGTSTANGSGVSTLSISNVAGLHEACVRLSYRTSTCSIQFTNPACLVVEGPLTVVAQPDDYIASPGADATFSATIANEGNGTMVYEWEESADNGVTWVPLLDSGVYSGTSTTVLTLSDATGKYNYRYQLRYRTSNCSSYWTNSAVLNVEGSPVFTDQPDDASLCSGGTTCFTVGVPASGAEPLSYQWQRWTPGGWIDITSNTPPYTGAFTNQLCISDVTGLHDAKFRCGVKYTTLPGDWVYSDLATLSIEGPITATLQPADASVCANNPHTFHATIVNAGAGQMAHQWQLSTDNGATWSSIPTDTGNNDPFNAGTYAGAFGQNLSLTSVEGMDGLLFRLVTSTQHCAYTTDAATLHLLDACLDGACDVDQDGITNDLDLDYTACNPNCLKLKLQLLPDSSGWAVMAKPADGFSVSENALTEAGRITLVAPADFVLDGFSSQAGQWLPTSAVADVPGHPGRKYFTFELQTQAGTHIPYDDGAETPLFQFDKVGDCPDSLYLLEAPVSGIQPNLLSGYEAVDEFTRFSFEYCGVYARKAWRCAPLAGGGTPGGPLIIDVADDLGSPQPGATNRYFDLPDGGLAEGRWFIASPNPASDFVNIVLGEKLAEGRPTLSLWDLQGKKRRELPVVETTATQLDLSGLPAGVYLVSLAQNGRILQREKLIKH